MSENKYLRLARAARDENNSEDAKKFYDMVRVEDPDNGEAKFFYQYYSLYEGKNGEIASRFIKLVNVLDSSIKMISESSDTEENKLETIKAIVKAFTPMPLSINTYMNTLTVKVGNETKRVLSNADIKSASETGVIGLYNLGDAIEKYFGSSPRAMNFAVIAWKEGVSLQQAWLFFKYPGKNVEDYGAKIQKIDSSYEIPKKGCLWLQKKR